MKWVALGLIRGYQRFVSPALPPTCRYQPTCSEYAYEAIGRYGIVRGSAKALWRILRCHPFSRGGFDPLR
ncbi:MAG: membrane protein insertion efficiency factor YidD [Chloroflexota bacterium]